MAAATDLRSGNHVRGPALLLRPCQTRPATVPRPGPSPTRPASTASATRAGRVIYVGKAKSLRSRLNSYFADTWSLHARTQQMVTTAAACRLGHRRQRGRGAAARVLLDQGVRPAVQRQIPRRQVLSVPGRHPQRGVPAAAGDARRQAQGRALLRAVFARLGHPRDPRPAAARLPGAHLLGRGVQARRPDRPALPARLHRQVLGAVRRHGQRRGAPGHRRRLLRLHGRPHRHVRQAARARHAAAPPRSSSSRRRPGCATTSPRCAGRWRSRPSCSATAPTPTSSPSPRTRSRRRSRSSTSATAASAASAAGWWRRSRT